MEEGSLRDPKKHISISLSILWAYPYLIGLLYKGGYMGYPYLNFCLCAVLGPYSPEGLLYRRCIGDQRFRVFSCGCKEVEGSGL